MKLTYKERLQKDYLLLQKQLLWLDLAYKDVKKIKLQDKYEVEDYIIFETLATRYIKSIEFLLEDSFIAIDNYEFKRQYSQMTLIKHAQNRKIITNIDDFRDLYDLRIKLLDEYSIDKLSNHFEELYFSTKLLITTINKTLDYINKIIR